MSERERKQVDEFIEAEIEDPEAELEALLTTEEEVEAAQMTLIGPDGQEITPEEKKAQLAAINTEGSMEENLRSLLVRDFMSIEEDEAHLDSLQRFMMSQDFLDLCSPADVIAMFSAIEKKLDSKKKNIQKVYGDSSRNHAIRALLGLDKQLKEDDEVRRTTPEERGRRDKIARLMNQLKNEILVSDYDEETDD